MAAQHPGQPLRNRGDGCLGIAWDAVSGATGYGARAQKAGAAD